MKFLQHRLVHVKLMNVYHSYPVPGLMSSSLIVCATAVAYSLLGALTVGMILDGILCSIWSAAPNRRISKVFTVFFAFFCPGS